MIRVHGLPFSPSEMGGREVVSTGDCLLLRAAAKRTSMRTTEEISEIQGKMARRTAEGSKVSAMIPKAGYSGIVYDVPGCSLLYLVDSPAAASAACTA